MKKVIIILVLILVVIFAALFFLKKRDNFSEYVQAENLPEVTELYFLDVGQGDATFIEFKNGTQALVDCGKSAKVLEELGRVMDFRDKSIDYLIITHPDNDHYGGCIDVLERFDVANVVYNGQHKNNDEFWNEFWRRVKKEGSNYHVVKSEEKWFVGDDVLHFLFPDGSLIQNLSDNNNSIVFILESAGKKVLFTGDMEQELEIYLIEKFGEKLGVDILKVGHHGSGSSSIDKFVDMVLPYYSIIPVGKNKYGHPSLRVMRRLERSGSRIFRTDLLHGVKILLDEELSMDQIK
ncbi:MAG: MBL fold metallo-hydrolase [Candidatus Magasanikbacteria bacterium]|nr:MBL fold metallo-hydrolase [Candidatus Magasanikbacteria bacterium]